jgi:capsule biosynthesis phosphatase
MRLVLDLDGTICKQTAGGDAYFTAEPREEVIRRVRVAKAAGWEVVIQTARGMNLFNGNVARIELEYRDGTERWLKENNVPFDALFFGKVAGDIYVDDKGVNVDDFITSVFDHADS